MDVNPTLSAEKGRHAPCQWLNAVTKECVQQLHPRGAEQEDPSDWQVIAAKLSAGLDPPRYFDVTLRWWFIIALFGFFLIYPN